MLYQILAKADEVIGVEGVEAHCDIPCGIYDPIIAQISALTIVRMIDLLNDLEKKYPEKDLEYQNSLTRYILVKEKHATQCKDEVRVIWGDYIKAPHIEQFPELHGLVHNIMQLGSKVKQTADRQVALELLEAVNRFAEIFWQTKNVEIKRAKAPYPPALEMVYPDL